MAEEDRSDGDSDSSSSSGKESTSSDGQRTPLPREGDKESAQKISEHDRAVHLWIKNQLERCLNKLVALPDATPFLTPLPYKKLGLMDYPDIIKEPMDLKTVRWNLESGEYDDDDGLIDPDSFWEDIGLIWQNCLNYYEHDHEAPPRRMAEEMQESSEEIEREFYDELDAFEKNIETVDARAATAAAVAHVTAARVGDHMNNLKNWFFGSSGPVKKDRKRRSINESQTLANPSNALVQTPPRKITHAKDTAAGKGRIDVTFKNGVPERTSERIAFKNLVSGALSDVLRVDEDKLNIDWGQTFLKPEDVERWVALSVHYSVRLPTVTETKELVDSFSVFGAKRSFEEALGESATVKVDRMDLVHNARKPLRDHYFDIILDRCNYDSTLDLQEIDEELTDAIETLLPLVTENDEEDDLEDFDFPEMKALVGMSELSLPDFKKSSHRVFSHAGGSIPNSRKSSRSSLASGSGLVHRGSSRSHGEASGDTPRSARSTPDILNLSRRSSHKSANNADSSKAAMGTGSTPRLSLRPSMADVEPHEVDALRALMVPRTGSRASVGQAQVGRDSSSDVDSDDF